MYWYEVYYIAPDGERGSLLCRGSFAGEAIKDASERLGDDVNITGALKRDPYYPTLWHEATVDGVPRRAHG